MGRKGTRYERVGDPWHPRRLRVVKGARRPFEATCAPAVDAADGKAWRWEGDRTGRGPAKLVFGVVASEAKESKEEEKKEETTPRRKETETLEDHCSMQRSLSSQRRGPERSSSRMWLG